MKNNFKYLLILALLVVGFKSNAQTYSELTLRSKLDSVSTKFVGYNNTVQLNITSLGLADLVNTLALENNLNISIDPSINQQVSYNFFDAQVKDVLVFLYQNFEIEYQFVGSILSVNKRAPRKETPIVIAERKADVKYNPSNQFLSVDLKNDTLFKVVKVITELSGKNIVIAPEIRDKQVSAYFLNRPFEDVLEMLSKANGIEYKADENDIYYLFQQQKTDKSTTTTNGFKPTNNFELTGVQISKNAFGTLDIVANNAELADIIKQAAQEINAPYFLFNRPEGKSSFEVQNVTFPDLLNLIFNGTKYAYKEDNRVYLIGESKTEGIRISELVRMENRTIENVKTAIPKDLMVDLDINEFLELNGLVISGPQRKVTELKTFLQAIDVVVPMVQIDVMIITSDRSHTIKSGIKAGVKDVPTTTSGTVFPTMDVNLGSQTINAILDGINGFGVVNLGNVTENFYLSLQLLESNGSIDVESTPKITTLSGHEAKVSIGQTTYYQEQQVDVQNSVVNSGVLTSKTWKSIDANLTVKIKPFVSADGNVTMSVTVTNDDFDGSKVDPTAPPNATKQTFESVIRVQNGEVVLLGGLDKKQNKNSGDGVPFLSRIPVIRWFFSSREKDKRKYKMHIIIRPTITY
jgi:type IV pilus assembly protein PilQ